MNYTSSSGDIFCSYFSFCTRIAGSTKMVHRSPSYMSQECVSLVQKQDLRGAVWRVLEGKAVFVSLENIFS